MFKNVYYIRVDILIIFKNIVYIKIILLSFYKMKRIIFINRDYRISTIKKNEIMITL